MLTRTRPDRSLLPFLVVLALLVGLAPAAVARTPQVVLQAADRADRVRAAVAAAATAEVATTPAPRDYDTDLAAAIRASSAVATPRVAWALRPELDTPEPKPRTESAAERASGGGGAAAGGSYRGRNHVWIPALGIDRSVSGFSCSSSAYPGDRVYRWGCAGRNNVYLFGHAHSVFKSLHDAYVRGRLKKGMKVYYADNRGRVTAYAVRWWKVVAPDKGAFAYAGQSTPSLTLQTCVGAKSQYRLVVRLTKAG